MPFSSQLSSLIFELLLKLALAGLSVHYQFWGMNSSSWHNGSGAILNVVYPDQWLAFSAMMILETPHTRTQTIWRFLVIFHFM